jgi:16S rRNA (guanine966-N2)-methyltransferase
MSGSRTRQSKPGSVRIIGGRWRRHRISIPAGDRQRPTPDRVRETVFNWLNPFLPGACCLDLYAGTGVLGFEALSRGAGKAVLVERDLDAVVGLERTNETLDAHAEIVCADAAAYLTWPNIGAFDIVFVDPPYRDAADLVAERLLSVLKPRAFVYLERARGSEWPELPGVDWSRRGTAGNVEFRLAEVGG